MTPKKFFTAQVIPAMPWVLSLAKSITASASNSQLVNGKLLTVLPSGKADLTASE